MTLSWVFLLFFFLISSLIDKIISYLKSTHGDLTRVYIGKNSRHLIS